MQKQHDKHDGAVIKRAGRKHEEESHGGAWKVAFADFCLALLALFLVLWLMATREQQAMKEVMESPGNRVNQGKGVMPEAMGGPRGSLIERFPLPRTGGANGTGTSGAGDAATAASPEPARVRYTTPADLNVLAKALADISSDTGLAANLEAIVTPYGLRVMLHDTEQRGMFVRGSAIPTDRFRSLLRRMGPLFAKMENQMLIVGHTDSSQYAGSDYAAYSNWTLSSNRAMAARANLLAGTMPVDSVLQVVGMADRAPFDAANTAAAVNRRIELLILTRGQANNVAAMFGVPHNREALTDEIDTAMPDVHAIKQLREKLSPNNRNSADASHRAAQ
ncbi:MAG: histidine kinase [Massilia sp.]|nr:histidine kinase [Massilia sp.]